MHLRRHGHFYVALAVAAATGGRDAPLRVLLAGNAFCLVCLALTAAFVARATTEHLRRSAAQADAGMPLILALTATIVGLSVAAILLLLRRVAADGAAAGTLAVASVPLGWLVLHTLAAFHYATRYYALRPGGRRRGRWARLSHTPEPEPWDFLYFAFVIGTTAQVSDVAVRSTRMRRTVVAHGGASFLTTR